jgi:hypothetical protein
MPKEDRRGCLCQAGDEVSHRYPLIPVKQGKVVALDVITEDIQHRLDIRQLPVQAGKTTTIVFTAQAKGEYAMTLRRYLWTALRGC